MNTENEGPAAVGRAVKRLKEEDQREAALSQELAGAVAKQLTPALPDEPLIYTNALAGTLIAEQTKLNDVVADLDRQIAELNAKRTNAMRASSMISAALMAGEKGRDG
jgi:hypothetical protein